MKLLTKALEKKIPLLYSQEGKGMNAIVHVKFFLKSFTWYALEYSPKSGVFYGYITSSHCPQGEFGNFTLAELESVKGKFGKIERDLYFEPKPLKNIFKE